MADLLQNAPQAGGERAPYAPEAAADAQAPRTKEPTVGRLLLSLLLAAVLAAPCIWALGRVMIPKWANIHRTAQTIIFQGLAAEPDNTVDVLCVGNSDVCNGISPMVFYERYGITGFDYATTNCAPWIAKYLILDALRTQSPKVVLYNVEEVLTEKAPTEGDYCKVYDLMQFSPVLLQGLADPLYDRPAWRKLGHFAPLFSYHDRYQELTEEDWRYAFGNEYSVLKGAGLRNMAQPPEAIGDYMASRGETAQIPERVRDCLDDIVAIAQENGIRLVFCVVPTHDTWNRAKHDALADYARKAGIDFLDLNDGNPAGVDWLTDTRDGGVHLNIWGAEKASAYLADYLRDACGLPDHRGEAGFGEWDGNIAAYRALREACIADGEKD